MVETGLSATELGPDGYLPTDPDELADYLASYRLTVVGGFVPALLHRPDKLDEELDYVRRAARQLAAAGSEILVLAPAHANTGYDMSTELSKEDWKPLVAGIKRLQDIVEQEGLATAVHPHWGMPIERPQHVERLLDSSEVGLCLDTGHFFLGGGDPVELARTAASRVIHVHLKDVDGKAADRVRSGQVPFRQAVVEGMFVPLGEGAVDISGVIRELESAGYKGWYVLEQDVSLTGEPAEGKGPKADAVTSVDFLQRLAVQLERS
jgi:inosose dehydratase